MNLPDQQESNSKSLRIFQVQVPANVEHCILHCGTSFTENRGCKAVLLQIYHRLLQLPQSQLPWPQCPVLSPQEMMLIQERMRFINKMVNYNIEFFCSDFDIAVDLLQKIEGGKISMEEVLRHPFHWSDGEKIRFICDVYEQITGRSREASGNLWSKLEEDKEGILPEIGDTKTFDWHEKLMLDVDEMNNIRSLQVKEMRDRNITRRVPVCAAVIYRKTTEENYAKTSIFDLMRFFRNCHSHYWEDDKDVRYAFGSYLSGYWKFFSRRYPKLFMHVYRKMMPELRNNERCSDHGTLFLSQFPSRGRF